MGWRVKRVRPVVSAEAQWRRKRKRGTAAGLEGELQLASLFAYHGEFVRAEQILRDAAKRWPVDPRLGQVRTTLRQLQGDFSPVTWEDGRVRRKAEGRFPTIPLWDGTPLPGQRVLIYNIDLASRRAEGPRGFGLGDVLMLSRMLAPVKVQSQAHVIFHVSKGLGRLMRRLQGPDEIVEDLPESGVDRQLPLVMTPSVCPLTPEIFATPYLTPDPDAVERWRPMFADRRVAHIGLHWQADASHIQGRERSLPLKTLAPLFDVPGVRWYSLQQGASAEVASYPQMTDLGDIDDLEARFVETAAVMTCLDLLICVDSGPSHLAGALGCPTWCLLNGIYDARWTCGSDRTPWYPQHQLWSQVTLDDWETLIVDGVKPALEQAVAQGEVRRIEHMS